MIVSCLSNNCTGQCTWTVVYVAEQVSNPPNLYILLADHPLDVLKALCLGAKAVGIGRPFMYAQGVSRLFLASRYFS